MNVNKNTIKRKIKLTITTKKICEAMKLISAVRFKKSNNRFNKLKPYYEEVYKTFDYLLSRLNDSKYLSKPFSAQKCLWIIVNSNLGFCGNYNQNVNQLVLDNIYENDQIIMIGSRVQKGFEKYQLLKTYRQIEVDFAFQDAQVIGIDVLTKFNYQEIDSIKLAYTRFINYSHFQPTILQLLPIVRSPLDAKVDADIEFEPNQNVVIETAVPLYLYTLIHGAVMESKLVEYASRCLVTEKAIENSKKMHEELLMKYNQLRQNKITQEIIEITGTLNT